MRIEEVRKGGKLWVSKKKGRQFGDGEENIDRSRGKGTEIVRGKRERDMRSTEQGHGGEV